MPLGVDCGGCRGLLRDGRDSSAAPRNDMGEGKEGDAGGWAWALGLERAGRVDGLGGFGTG